MPDLEMPNLPTVQCSKLKISFSFIVVLAAVITGVCLSNLHRVEEGYVGIYFKNGALMDTTAQPGVHYMTPFIVDVKMISIRDQTDILPSISAITRDGISNNFNDVQVISRVKVNQLIPMVKKYGLLFRHALINDRVKEELRIFCANHTTDEVYNLMFLKIAPFVKQRLIESIDRLGMGGIEILNLVISKPQIPSDIANNYRQVKVQWTEQLVAKQKKKTEEIKKDTEKIKAIADAQRKKAVLEIQKETERITALADASRAKDVMEIQIKRQLLEKEGALNISAIENQIRKEREENIADIAKYKTEAIAVANNELYSDQYVTLEVAKALANNTKIYFSGEHSEIGALFSKIFNRP